MGTTRGYSLPSLPQVCDVNMGSLEGTTGAIMLPREVTVALVTQWVQITKSSLPPGQSILCTFQLCELMNSPYCLSQFRLGVFVPFLSGWKCNVLCEVLGNQNEYDSALLSEDFLCPGTMTSELQADEDFQVLEHQKKLTGLEFVKGML